LTTDLSIQHSPVSPRTLLSAILIVDRIARIVD
jgi:hypothetical protein